MSAALDAAAVAAGFMAQSPRGPWFDWSGTLALGGLAAGVLGLMFGAIRFRVLGWITSLVAAGWLVFALLVYGYS